MSDAWADHVRRIRAEQRGRDIETLEALACRQIEDGDASDQPGQIIAGQDLFALAHNDIFYLNDPKAIYRLARFAIDWQGREFDREKGAALARILIDYLSYLEPK